VCETKVVSTDCDGVRDIMKGKLSDYLAQQQIQDLAEKMVKALDNESIDYVKYLEDFMPNQIVQKYINVYTKKEKAI